jgi:hypothetical protein
MKCLTACVAFAWLALAAPVAAQDKSPEIKIHAKTATAMGKGPAVLRSGAELAKFRSLDEDKASAEVAKLLKVDSIDWKKQMLIVVAGGQQRTGGYSVETKSLVVKDGKLIVHWKLNTPKPGGIVIQVLTNPIQTILVDRFEGDVVFDPASPPKK